MTLYAISGSRARALALVVIGAVAFALAFVATHGGRNAAGSQGDGSASPAQVASGAGVPDALSPVAALPALGSTPPASTPASAPRRTAGPTALPVTLPVTSGPRRVLAPAPVSAAAPAPSRPAAPKRQQSPGIPFDDSG